MRQPSQCPFVLLSSWHVLLQYALCLHAVHRSNLGLSADDAQLTLPHSRNAVSMAEHEELHKSS